MTPPKEKEKEKITDGDEAGMSDVGVGGLFKGPQQGGGTPGALAGWAQPQAAAAPVQQAHTPAPVPAQPYAVAQQSAPEEQLPELSDAETAKPVGFYVSATVASRLRKFRTQQNFNNTEIVLLAAEAAAEKGIAATVTDARRTPKIQSKLFPVALDDSDLRGLGPVQLQYKPTRAQRRIIDQLVAESGLPDHTKFVAIALDQYLPGKRDS